MSCVDKHNNPDLKFCPECGLKLEHQEKYVEGLNKLYNDYRQSANELGIDVSSSGWFAKYLNKKNIKIQYPVYLIENEFYTKEQARKLFEDPDIIDSTYFFKQGYCDEYSFRGEWVFEAKYKNISNMNCFFKDDKKNIIANKLVQKFIADNAIGSSLSYTLNYIKSALNGESKDSDKKIVTKFIDECC